MLEEQAKDTREAVLASSKEVGSILSSIADASESAFGVRPNELGMRIIDAMFSGKPLAPIINVDSNQIEGTFEMARAKMKAGDLHGAVSLFRVLVMLDFYGKRHWLMLALCLQRLGLWTSAGDSYCMGHVVDRDDLWPVVRAIECYLAAEDLQNAEELLEILNSLAAARRAVEDTESEELSAAIEEVTSRVTTLRADNGQV